MNNISLIDSFLTKNDFSLLDVIHISRKRYNQIIKSGKIEKYEYRYLSRLLLGVSLEDINNETQIDTKKLTINPKVVKIRYLNSFLKKKYQVDLYRAISMSEHKINGILKGHISPSKNVINRIATYFALDPKILLDDNLKLPKDDLLQVDEDLISILKNDYEHRKEYFKNKHYFTRNYRVLSHKKRIRLILTSLLFVIPLIGYTAFCVTSVVKDRHDVIEKYKNNDMEEDSKQRKEKADAYNKEHGLEDKIVNIDVGAELFSISNIDPASSTYRVKMKLFFDFDQLEFYQMYLRRHYPSEYASFDPSSIDLSIDNKTLLDDGTYYDAPDNVPDDIEFSDSLYTVPNVKYLKAVEHYPGETSSNNFPEKETMFELPNGDIVADSFSYDANLAYSLVDESNTIREYRYFQKMTFEVDMHKAFDSIRYPLESLQFHVYICPKLLSSEYIQYNPIDEINITTNGTRYLKDGTKLTCTLENNVYSTGVSPVYFVTSGYKIINVDDLINKNEDDSKIKGFVTRLAYYQESSSQTSYFTEYELLVRVNRTGLNTFAKAFINLFSVVIWIIIAFYSQAYFSENALDMLGTGLFAAISSILVGLSMVSDAGFFSLITMVNIFTLAVILVMTYFSIMARQAQVRQDKVAIAFNGIRLRIMFIVLSICTLAMFIGLPLAAYIFAF